MEFNIMSEASILVKDVVKALLKNRNQMIKNII